MVNDYGVNHFMQKIAREINDKLHTIKTSGIPLKVNWPQLQKWYHMKNDSEFIILVLVFIKLTI